MAEVAVGRADRNSSRGWGARETAYTRWRKAEGVPFYTGSHVEDLRAAEVAPWPRLGQKGAIVNLAAQEHDDGWLVEIEPGGHTEPIHHLFEASYYVLEGRGATTVWQPGSSSKQTVEWQQGALFSPPANCWYQHFNLDGQRRVRLFCPTTAPLLMNALQDSELVFNCDWSFKDRYNGQEDYFTNPGEKIDAREWKTNLLTDVRTFKLEDRKERGAGSSILFFYMAGNGMNIHISEFPPGMYKKAHRHGPGAEIIILGGVGYSLLWFPGDKERVKVDWREGSVFSPLGGQYHQHFNTGNEPARYLAYTFGHVVVSNTDSLNNSAALSESEGGWQIEYEDEDPAVFDLFQRECAQHGASVSPHHPLAKRLGVG